MDWGTSIAKARFLRATDIAGRSTRRRAVRCSAAASGIVVLRRLEDAVASSDHIRAVILGSAINNDGRARLAISPPVWKGRSSHSRGDGVRGCCPADISYVETHGTGTVVGDPIEVRALTQAFRHEGTQSGSCAIGSVKSNVGHLDAAAGVTGLIKTVLALENAQLPPSLHFETLNPRIDLSGSPFFVNNKLARWNTNRKLRRAGVTALGIGGTNAHVVLEEAPERTIKRVPKPHELLTVSAKSAAAADATLVNLVAHLAAHPAIDLGDTAWTCQVGRQPFAHRRALVVENSPQAIAAIVEKGAKASATGAVSATRARVAFLFWARDRSTLGWGTSFMSTSPSSGRCSIDARGCCSR